MKKIIIFGNSDFARQMKWYIDNDTFREVVCFCADKQCINENIFQGLPLVDFEEIEKTYSPQYNEILIAIGQSKMNDLRRRIFYECKKKGYDVASYFHSSCTISSKDIGEGNIILEKTLIQPYAKIGNGNLIWYGISIAHDNVIGDFNTIAGGTSLCGYVTIGNNCYLGNASMVYDHVTIDNYTLIGAGAYVKYNTNPYSVVVPARSVVLNNKKSVDFM